MAIHPKLEFYRFKLNPRQEDFKTFKDFVIDELKGRRPLSDEKAMQLLFTHFIKSLGGKYAQDKRLNKQIKLESRKSINKYLDNKPKIVENNIICGVINGGPFGRDRIIGDITNPEEGTQLGMNKSVLQYYYFLLYLPLEHNEGCFIIHSNSKEETITNIFRKFISNIFQATKYNKANPEAFCPKSFQDEFKKGALIKSIEFKDSQLDSIHTKKGIDDIIGKFAIKIEAIPQNKGVSISESSKVKAFFENFIFGKKQNSKKLSEFDNTKITTINPVDNSTKIFEWNTKDAEFVPIVYLDGGRISNFNDDDTPDFFELERLCLNYLKDEVLPELRPDLKARIIE
jgi:hypothetical protein